MINEDPNAKLIRELKDEVDRLREILRLEGIDVGEGHSQFFFFLFRLSMLSFACLVVACFVVLKSCCSTLNITAYTFRTSWLTGGFHVQFVCSFARH